MNLQQMKKAQLIDLLEGSLVGELTKALPPWSELTDDLKVRVRLALKLAAFIDAGDEVTPGHFKEMRALLDEVISPDDTSSEFFDDMSPSVGNAKD